MPDYRRLRIPGATIFFSVGLERRQSSMLVNNIDQLRYAVAATQRERPFTIDAFVVLPDHLHCIWTLPERDSDYSVRWGAIKARFSMGMRRAGFTPPLPIGREKGGVNPALRRKGEVGLWRPRFWEHHIRSNHDFRAHQEFCLWDPVRHGLVDHPDEWPFSSIHRDRMAGTLCDSSLRPQTEHTPIAGHSL